MSDIDGSELMDDLEFVEEFLLTELTPDNPPSRLAAPVPAPPTVAVKPSLEKVSRALKGSSPLSMEGAFELLQAVRRNDPAVAWLPVRGTASPLLPLSCTSYVVRRGRPPNNNNQPQHNEHSSSEDSSSTSSHSAETSVTVSFQSIVNSEVWWCPASPGEGVASRPMSRTRRERGADKKSEHGYRGRMYTLIQRAPGDEDLELPSKRRRKEDETKRAKFVAFGDCVVHAWRHADEISSSSSFSSENPMHYGHDEDAPKKQQVFDGSVVIEGDLRVRGVVYGQLCSKPRCADYAEWFRWAEDHLEFKDEKVIGSPPPGSVTQLRSPEQKLTLDTSGEGPCLIVSTSPSVAAGVPEDDTAKMGALVAFIGQVPVRCRGRVEVGDQLVPSMLNDGCAVSLRDFLVTRRAAQRNLAMRLGRPAPPPEEFVPDALGVAMEGGYAPQGEERTLLCFVRWNHAVRRELKEQIEKAGRNMNTRWMIFVVDCITVLAYLIIALECLHIGFTFFHPGGVERRKPAESTISFFAFLQILLVITLYVVFSQTHALVGGRTVFLFWLILLVLLSVKLAARDDVVTIGLIIFDLIFSLAHISYNLVLVYYMADIRGGMLRCCSCCFRKNTTDLPDAADQLATETTSQTATSQPKMLDLELGTIQEEGKEQRSTEEEEKDIPEV